MSMYNDIVRRHHLPREHAIRRIMAATGVDLSLYGASSSENLVHEDHEEEDPGVEEDGESEEDLVEDPCSFAGTC